MADYGVNIAVAVKNSQAVTQLSNKLKDTAAKIESINSRFNSFANMTGKVLPGSIANFNKALSDAAKNLNDVALNTDEAVTAAREFVEAQNAANAALKERNRLVKEIRREGATVREQPFGAPGVAGGPQLPKGFDPVVGRQRAIAQMVMLETAADVKVADAKRKHTLEIGRIQLDLDRKIRNAQIDNIIEEYRIQNELEDAKFKYLMKNTELFEAKFFEKLGIRKSEEIKAIKEVEQERRKAARETLMLTGQTSPIGGAENIPGSPAAKAKTEREQRFLRDKFNRDQRLRSATSSALIGGAFPLLFGQGLGASAGGLAGGFGGGMIGGEFGFGVSLIGTQLGAMFDQLVAKATGLASSLETTESILSGLEEAGFKVSDSTKRVIASYEEAGLLADAYSLAIDEVNRVLGPDGADKLHAYKTETEKLQSEFEKASAALQSELIPALTGFLRVILGVKSAIDGFAETPLGKAILNAGVLKQAAFAFPGLGPAVAGGGAFIGKLQEIGAPTGPAEKSDAQIAAEQEALEGQLITRQALNKAAREQGYLVDAQIKVAELGNNLLDERVVAAKESLIQETFLAAVRKKDVTFQEVILAGKRKRLALANLERSVDEARLAQQEKELRNADLLEKKNDRIAKKKQKDAERLAKAADNELARADRAFNNANNQLNQIIQKHEDKMAFEREYAELIKTGSTPAAAKQAVQLQKELLDLDRKYKKLEEELKLRIKIAEAEIIKAEADPNADLDRIDGLRKKLKELQGDLAGLPGKKEDAEGAIAAALAPKSDRQRLLDYMTELQGQINEMMDPVRQLTALAETLGSAFGESFKGLVTGSMTAREALANLFQRTADHFLDMAAQMIAAQIKMQILGIGLQLFGGAVSGGASAPSVPADKSGTIPSLAPGLGGGTLNDPKGLFTPPTLIAGKALGGAVGAGQPYLVGEKGPELFVPGAQGNIVPNNAMGGSNIVVNVDASGSSVEGDAQQSKALGQAIGAAVQAEIVKQKMPGGLLN